MLQTIGASILELRGGKRLSSKGKAKFYLRTRTAPSQKKIWKDQKVMNISSIADRFAEELEKVNGTPDGRTDDYIQSHLEEKYKELFVVINQINERVSFQNKDTNLPLSSMHVDRPSFSAIYFYELRSSSGSVPLPFTLSRTGIRGTQGYLQSAGPRNNGEWLASEADNFAIEFANAILKAYSPSASM